MNEKQNDVLNTECGRIISWYAQELRNNMNQFHSLTQKSSVGK